MDPSPGRSSITSSKRAIPARGELRNLEKKCRMGANPLKAFHAFHTSSFPWLIFCLPELLLDARRHAMQSGSPAWVGHEELEWLRAQLVDLLRGPLMPFGRAV